ncbi:MAG: hypothetical protein CO184_00505 [Candidatus Zambryskibacteria bacterium CG_4_9_14_3_um_filter_40_16]|uniref:Glycosyl transferase family 1 domain-containing protein n=2 Tax=Candidatus Zambryskiibacteriota TaxID=1817925 RepID=A0A2M7WV31_9BACT|nr:MAG: hypothetical protein CO184_00505 [Candidatus Zambryskibacteria bacterium CG_4_9_14_3_um_filter_40_16]
MKRVLIFSTAYLPLVGGAEIAVKENTDRLGADFEFDMITARFNRRLPSKEKIGTVNVYRLGLGISFLDKMILPFLGALKAYQLDKKNHYLGFWAIMITYASGAAYILNIFRAIFGGRLVPIILTLQEGDSEKHMKYRWAGMIAFSWRVALKRTTFLTSISSYLENRAKSMGYRGPSVIIPNGVDVARFSAEVSEKKKDDLKKKLGKKKDDVFLITVSRLTAKNAINDIVSALYFLPDNIKILILGTGEEKDNLVALTKKREAESRVKFIGYVDHKELPLYFAVSDIFIRPSLSEGFGNSFVEAMAAEVPVIATSVGGIVDFLFDPDKNPGKEPTGLFCNPKDPQSIAKQVKKYLDNPALRTQTVLNAKKMVGEKYDWNIIANDMKKKVFDVMSGSAKL